jgi:hypothetical protein
MQTSNTPLISEEQFINNKNPKKIYISKRIENKQIDPTTGKDIITPIRYVSKVVDSLENWDFVKEKEEIKLRLTHGGKQEVLAKVLERNNEIYALTIQKFTRITGTPHKISFSFVREEIKILKNFLDHLALLSFPNEYGQKIEDSELLQIKESFLQNPDLKLIEEILKNNITDKDVIALGYRKNQLNIFRKILEENYLDTYREYIAKEESKNKNSIRDEYVWQYFFSQNPWIFGYGLDYRFQGILQKEFHASNSEADGSNEVIGDFLLGDKKFTTFVELKKPNTEIFGLEKNRSNSWRLSNHLIDAVSQILEQKAAGQIKLDKIVHDNKGNEIKQKAYDSKTILIIGNWNQIKDDSDLIRKIKEKTFELFRRDSKNIEIVTYDELYERAKFIVDYN